MPPASKPDRAVLNVTINARLVDWLRAESDARMLGVPKLVEVALTDLRVKLAVGDAAHGERP